MARWAGGRALPVYRDPPSGELEPFDYLFSIFNALLIPKSLIERARTAAINYHDAPLPRYAGLHATSWALVHREPSHGVTWHRMVEKIDAGDIVEQALFPIAPRETAFSLNLKCFDAAVHLFDRLADDVAAGQPLARRPQDLTERTYFGMKHQLERGGLISWRRPAREADALVRALDLRSAPNALSGELPLGSAKILVGDELLRVSETDLDEERSGPPGQLLGVAPDGIFVATSAGTLVLRALTDLDGAPRPLAELAARHDLRAGAALPEPPPALVSGLEAGGRWVSHERFWLARLLRLDEVAGLEPLADAFAAVGAVEVVEDEPTDQAVPPARVVAGAAAFLGRLAGTGTLAFRFRDERREMPEPLAARAFASQVPLMASLSASSTLAGLASEVGRELDELLRHGTYARDLVLREPRLAGKAERLAALPVAIEHVLSAGAPPPDPGAGLVIQILPDGRTRFIARPASPGGLTELYRRFTRFFTQARREPERRLLSFALLDEAERRQVLVDWNDTARAFSLAGGVHQLLEEQVARTPDASALVFEGAALTYRELERRANQLARLLVQRGVGPEVLVGLCLPRSLELVVALYAVLKAGGAFVPLDPAQPGARLAGMLADARAKLVVTRSGLADRLPAAAGRLLLDDPEVARALAAAPETPLGRRADAAQLAYVLYTSGSTGAPKGVAVPHGALANHTLACAERYRLAPSDRVLQFAQPGFDVALEELVPSLARGACVVLRTDDAPAALAAFLTANGITVLNLPSGYWQQWTAELVAAGARVPPSLRLLIVGSEVGYTRDLAAWRALGGDALPFASGYGPTEATITASLFERAAGDSELPRRPVLPIGKPIANVRLYVLDEELGPVPPGVAGELYIGGAGLARGYVGSPERTAERFLPDPFGAPGGRLYRTGDRARWSPSGELEILGRTDHQVKVRGFRIELGEIEAALAALDHVAQAVVVAREEGTSTRLCAYVVPSSGAALAPRELREALKARLPEYMIPSTFTTLAALPLTEHGKLDRRALPPPDSTRAEATPPRTATERLVANILTEVLGIEPIGVDEDFFALGGDSLHAIRVVSRLRDLFGVEVPLLRVFDAGTVVRLIDELAARAGGLDKLSEISALIEEVEGLTEDQVRARLEAL